MQAPGGQARLQSDVHAALRSSSTAVMDVPTPRSQREQRESDPLCAGVCMFAMAGVDEEMFMGGGQC